MFAQRGWQRKELCRKYPFLCSLMGLFSDSSFLSSPSSIGFSRQLWQPLFQHLTQVRELQTFCAQSRHLHGAAFIAELLRQLQITVSYDLEELRRLPAHGAFLTVANHPASLLDELVLLHVLSQRRPDLRLVASKPLATLLPQLTQQLVLVPATRRTKKKVSPKLSQVVRYLHNDVPVAIFAAIEEKHRGELFGTSQASPAPVLLSKFLEIARVPVVPVWTSAHHSTYSRWLGLVQPWLGAVPLPAALLHQRGQTIQVRIAQPLSAQELTYLPPDQRWPCIQAGMNTVRHPPDPTAKPWPRQLPQAVAAAGNDSAIEADLVALSASRRLVVHGPWEVYVARQAEVPHIMAEIGRLRELAFRRIGEGSPQGSHSDAHDRQHRHIFLYHREARCIIGACRLGKGHTIVRQCGKQGFRFHSFFRLRKEGLPLLRESLELGCAFIRAEYQQQDWPAVLLWKGLAEYVATHPTYRYLLAPVAISSSCPDFSKAKVVKCLSHYFLDTERAPWVRPRKAYRYRPLTTDEAPASTQPGFIDSRQDAQNLIADLAPAGLAVPTPLRAYFKENARFLGFNVDPGFANALHGLLLLDVRELPLSALCLLNRPA